MVVALALAWIARRQIATNFLESEFESRGVQATYRLDRVGLRTQQVSNLVIGNPARPDLIAKFAQVEVRLKWNGSFQVYRIVARGVRLRGKLVNGKVSWGQVDKLLPPPSDKPFELPDFALDIADSTISLSTPFGPFGIAIEGNGNLTGGFKGRLAAVSPRIIPGRCEMTSMRTNLAVDVVARRPHAVGPLTIDRVRCPASQFEIVKPRFEVDTRFNESLTNYDGRGRMAIETLVAGANGLAAFVGDLTFNGNPEATYGTLKLSAQRSRLADIYADRTHLEGKYRLGITGGTVVMVGDYAVNSANLSPSAIAGVTRPLGAAKGTPIGPIATSIANAIGRTSSNFNAAGKLRMVNFPGGGAIRIEDADARGATGGRVRISGGDGITYYWPASRVRIDGLIETAGGGLPTGRILLRQPRNGAPMSGEARFAPYVAGGQRLALAPIRFAASRDGTTAVSTVAQLDGSFPDGRVRALRVPLSGRFGANGSWAIGNACAEVRWGFFQMGSVQFKAGRLPICPVGSAILAQPAGGAMRVGAIINRPNLTGRLGNTPLRLAARTARIVGKNFEASALALRLGKGESPVVFDADRLRGTFSGSGISGTFAGATSTIGTVPMRLSDGDGRWRIFNGDLTVNAGLTVSDRVPEPRFYPLRGDAVTLTIADDFVRANGTLRHPASGTRVTDVAIEHRLSTGIGSATLDVPGLTFGEGLQPEELTRLTEGVIALVNGTIRGQGRINWDGSGKVTSTGDFSTASLDLAAPFGPVTGLSGTIHFDDLLKLTTPPGQTLTMRSINPGILVENGVVRYQLLPDQLVKIERGEWPFMGGTLILRETVLNFARPTAKRLTFEVVGLDAKVFVETLGFAELQATGVFDGVLPMIFDENGGRIVGGRLDSRPGGGSLMYNGVVNKANLGMMGGIAFDALRDLRFRSMIVRLDGDLAGEFATRLTIDGVALGQTGTQKIIRGLLKRIPLKMNVTIRGPFRALIATAKAFRDPRQIIADVLPRPLDKVPGIVTEVRRREEEQTQTQTPPSERVTTTPTPAPSER
ncbi:MAG TPA: YdbH domain-containing protein [Sphingomicrobium sp.]|nr:YdbH domain-containing protein [Sphingomicrobium sp.]